MSVNFKETTEMSESDLATLYNDVSWTSYTEDMPKLVKALQKSLYVLTAWDESRLIGLIRVVGDGETIIYIQDILVLEAYQNKGIGSRLISMTLDAYHEVRQKFLLTNDAPDVRSFYEKHGFASCDQGNLVAFANLK